MADTEQQTQRPVEQQVTSQTPAKKPKNPKRVEAAKETARRTKLAREEQRKALIEVQRFIAQAKPPADPVADTPSAEPETPTKKVLTTTQWLSIISIIVSLVGLYYKREEIKRVLTKKADPPVLPRSPPPLPVDAAPKINIRQMD